MDIYKVERTCSFEVEADKSFPPEKIYNFFIARSIPIKEFSLLGNKENIAIYLGTYSFSLEAISALELIRDDELFKITKLNNTNEYDEILAKLVEEEKAKIIIDYAINYEDDCQVNYIKSYGAEGMEFINQDIIKKQRSLLTYILKKIGTNILSGRSIMNISLPIYIFDSRSVLEAFAFGYRYAPYYLDRAADAKGIERLKLCTAYCMALISTQINTLKPFNPILGETFQVKIGEANIYAEQTSHHPPILNYYVTHPKYVCWGYYEIEITSTSNSLNAETRGKFYVKFSDGGFLRYTPPRVKINGLMIGKRYLNLADNLSIEDLTNNMISVINYTREPKSFFGKMFGSSPKVFPDYINGFVAYTKDVYFDDILKIYKLKSQDAALSKFEGEWSFYLNCDGQEYWKASSIKLSPMEKMSFTLPSDSRIRHDIILLRNGYDQYSQQAKIHLEEVQRNDRKLRAKYNNGS